MPENGERKLEITVSMLQFVVWTLGKMTAVAVAVYMFCVWVASNTFVARLDEFHKVAVPQIEQRMDEKIKYHESAAGEAFQKEIGSINSRFATIDQENLDQSKKLDRIEDKLDRLLQR